MPEIVEVALTALYLNNEIVGKKLKKINVTGGRYSRHTMKGLSAIKKDLPLKITKVNSKGKFMWFELEKGYYIMNTYGLEGGWTITKLSKKDHSNVEFELVGQDNLYFTDSRNFGTIEITTDKNKIIDKLNSLGPDLLKESFTNKQFYDRIDSIVKNKSGTINKLRANVPIIKVLMNQKSKLGSGLGNYLAVEALYHSKISPHTKIGIIAKNKKLTERLGKSIKYIIKLSFMTAEVGYLSDLDDGFDKFIKKVRKQAKNKNSKYNYHKNTTIGKNKFNFIVYRQKQDLKGNPVKGDKIIKGRTTYWVPKVQK